jgi:hypothetical protein
VARASQAHGPGKHGGTVSELPPVTYCVSLEHPAVGLVGFVTSDFDKVRQACQEPLPPGVLRRVNYIEPRRGAGALPLPPLFGGDRAAP